MPITILNEPAAFRQVRNQTSEYCSHRLRHSQGVRRKLFAGSCHRCHFPEPEGELCRRKFISGRHGILEFGAASRGDHLV